MALNNNYFLRLFLLIIAVFIISCKRDAKSDFVRNAYFNAQWQFHLCSGEGEGGDHC